MGSAVRRVIARTAELEATTEALDERFVLLEQRVVASLERRAAGDEKATMDVGVPSKRSTKKERDNALQDTVRTCLYSLMGVTAKTPLPKPCELQETWWEAAYTRDTEDNDMITKESLLRPQWGLPWTENEAGWSLKVAVRIQSRGTEYTTALTQEHLASLSRETVIGAIRAVFMSMAKRWKMESAGEHGEEQRQLRNSLAKCKMRKKQKCIARTSMRKHVPRALDSQLDYLLQWQYQSTDESEVEDVVPAPKQSIDPDTDEEPEHHKTAKSSLCTVWVSRALGWRQEETNDILDEIDGLVRKERAREKKTKLPNMSRVKKAVLIPRVMVHSAWLRSKHGQKYNSARFIAADGYESDDVLGGDNMGEDGRQVEYEQQVGMAEEQENGEGGNKEGGDEEEGNEEEGGNKEGGDEKEGGGRAASSELEYA
ncbi:hypothetical protein C2E23DRAFT_882193 [Lenzites betulinus]|nr:hypothetical protein C2E23DRAFT_882193 [Lenzites betulinus]